MIKGEASQVSAEELNSFFKNNNIDFKIDVTKYARSKEESFANLEGEELTIGELSYKIIPQRDFFKGVPTILNSETAALVMAEKIFKSIPDGSHFIDKDFGPKDENDIDGNRFALYCTGVPPHRGFYDPSIIEWLMPEDITDKKP